MWDKPLSGSNEGNKLWDKPLPRSNVDNKLYIHLFQLIMDKMCAQSANNFLLRLNLYFFQACPELMLWYVCALYYTQIF